MTVVFSWPWSSLTRAADRGGGIRSRRPSPNRKGEDVSETQPETNPDVQPDETPDTQAPDTQPDVPPDTQADDDEAEAHEAEPTEPDAEPEAEGPIGAVGERELERMFKKVDAANLAYHKRLEGAMGEEVQVLEPCPRCNAPFLGFIFPPIMKPVTAEVKNAVLVSVGEQAAEASEPDPYARTCDTCKGSGVTLSGSKRNSEKALACLPCKGRGWTPVGPERSGGTVETPAAPVTNGEVTHDEPSPDRDPWGRGPGDPDYGRLPQFVGAR